jgi:hypothetical protein
MRVSTTVEKNDLPDRFREVFKIVPKDSWYRRAQVLADRERQNSLLKDYFDERYTIERSLVLAVTHWDQWDRSLTVDGITKSISSSMS